MKVIIDVTNQIKANNLLKEDWIKDELRLIRTFAYSKGTRVRNIEIIGDEKNSTFVYLVFHVDINTTLLRSKNKRLYIPFLEWLSETDYTNIKNNYDKEFFESFSIQCNEEELELIRNFDKKFYTDIMMHQPIPIY